MDYLLIILLSFPALLLLLFLLSIFFPKGEDSADEGNEDSDREEEE